MYAVTSIPLERRTRAIFRSAEFGFFGVMVFTWVQTPRFCGDDVPLRSRPAYRPSALFVNPSAGALVFFLTVFRPFLTNWLIVGTCCASQGSVLRTPLTWPAPIAGTGQRR